MSSLVSPQSYIITIIIMTAYYNKLRFSALATAGFVEITIIINQHHYIIVDVIVISECLTSSLLLSS